MFFTYSIKKEASLILKDAPEIVVQKIVAGLHDLLPVSYIDTIKNIRGWPPSKAGYGAITTIAW